MKQFQAGYVLDGLTDVFQKKSSELFAFSELANWCSFFTFQSRSKFEENSTTYPSNIAVLINLLQRGAPTKLNKLALDFLVGKSEVLKFNDENDSIINAQFRNITPEITELVFRSLHLIEPRLNIKDQKEFYSQSWEKLGSAYEESFLYDSLPGTLRKNGPAFIQLLASQRSIASIAKTNKMLDNLQNQLRTNFESQRTDFSIQFPYTIQDKPKGIVIEIDGSQHNDSEQKYLDTVRDKIVAESGWHNTLRIKTSEFTTAQFENKIRNILVPAVSNAYVKNCINNFSNPVWKTKLGKNIFQLSLIPFAVARLQRVILEAITHGKLKLNAKEWKIAVIERDVPCAQLAIDDLIKLTEALAALSENPLILPKIKLSIFSTQEFIDSQYQSASAQPLSSYDSSNKADLLIDIAVLQRFNNDSCVASNANDVITIRSIHFIDTTRKTATSDLIKYKPFCVNQNNTDAWIVQDKKAEAGLEYLLQSIFRKKRFREGQLPILHNALQCKSVIGLLPTGGGKSLTYQLSALLQPGICMVIDPIRSLMKDQVDGLYRNNIDACIYINSTLQGEEKRKAMRKMASGEAQFVFISPERLQMEEFRNLLSDMYDYELYFSYCVIDEAHCVSEWGHDFRTAYLRLGENAILNCKTKNLEHLPLFGLTATASYDVLADVQRELSGNDEKRRLTEDSIIRSEYSKRNELQFLIEEVTFPTGAIKNIWDLKSELSAKKLQRVNSLLTNMPEILQEFLNNPYAIFSEKDWELNEKNEHQAFDKLQIDNFDPLKFYHGNTNAGLIFCPHTQGPFGVTDKFKINATGLPVVRNGIFDNLASREGIKAGYFIGSGDDSDAAIKKQEESFENQDKFINNELNLMVATKAFGMGIDKENIRYTIHLNYPGSIESFVQEAGRAGRDGKIAISCILFNEQKVVLPNEDEPIDHDLDINMYFHKNSFKGIAKELAVLDELLTEIYFPDRTFELENLINNEFDLNVKCNYWEGGASKNLYFELGYNEPLGYFSLNKMTGYTNYTKKGGVMVNSVLPEVSEKMWVLLHTYISNLNLNEPVHLWLQRSDKQIGIERILQSKREGEPYSITVGFYNNTKERVTTLANWLKKVVHSYFNEQTVQKMRANSNDAEAFIEEVCSNYERFTQGKQIDFEAHCLNRDKDKGKPRGSTYKAFMAYFNGYRDKLDTEKAIYRLSTLGIIDDYTVNFSSNTFTLKGRKKDSKEYYNNLISYLLKYYSVTTANAKVRNLNAIDEPTPMRKTLNFLVNFVYTEIQKKRELAIHDMRTACRIGLEKNNVELKDYIDLYFNSKYARNGYYYINDNGQEVNASLPDITNNGKNDNLKWVWLFTEIVDEDPKAGQIDNIKHLRGACTRMLNNQPDSYTLLLLNAYALYMLEYKNQRYLAEAETFIFNAFTSIQEKHPDWSDDKLEEAYYTFTKILKAKNAEIEQYMDHYGFSFDFDAIMINRLLNPLQSVNSTLKNLNKILT